MKINFNPDERMLRQFGLLCVLFFGLLCCMRVYQKADGITLLYGAIAAAAGVLALTRPTLLKPVFVGWTIAVFPIGFVMSYLILLCLYFLVFTPVGILLRLSGKDPLRLRSPQSQTCWLDRGKEADRRRYFRQF